MSPRPRNDPSSREAKAIDKEGNWTMKEILATTMKESVVGQTLYWASRHRIGAFQEEKEDFVVPARYQRDAETQSKLSARQRRLDSQEKLKYKSDKGKNVRDEEKPIRIAGVKSDPRNGGEKNREITEAVQRERAKQESNRAQYPVRIAPPRMDTSDLEAQVMCARSGEGEGEGEAERMSRRDSDETHVGDEGEGPGGGAVSGKPFSEDEEGLGIKDDEDPNIVTWYGEDDRENPLNWSPWKKAHVTFCICLITVTVYSASSMVSPGTLEANEYFHVGQVAGTLGLTTFVAGYGVGPLILSPLTEIPSIGRTWPYIICLTLFCIMQVPTLFVDNFAGYLVLRFVAGFLGSPPLATGGASISDMYGPKTRPYALGLWGLAASSGPALGPVVAAFAVAANGFRWAFWIILWLSAGSLLFLIFFLPETSAINILVRRARRLRKRTGYQELKSEGEIEQANMTTGDIVSMTLIRPFQLTITQPIILILNVYIGFIYAILYSFFESFTLVFIDMYGFPLSTSGLPFLGLLVGSILGYTGYCIWQATYWNPKFDKRGGNLEPEYRLHPTIVGAFFIPICLFCFGWSSGRTSYWAPIVFSGFFGAGTFLLFQGILNYLPDTYPAYAASVLASNDFIRAAFGAAMPVVATPLFGNLGVARGCTLLGGTSVAFIPIPFLLIHFGGRIRRKSDGAETIPGEEERKPAF